MAHLMYFTHGTKNIEVGSGSMYTSSSDGYRLLKYVPQSPDISTIDSNSVLSDGGKRSSVTRRNVTEQAVVLYSGSSHNDVSVAFQNLQRIFTYSEYNNEYGGGSPGYVNFATYGSTSPYRSRILSGKAEVTEESLDSRFTRGEKSIFTLTFTREYFWEGQLQNAKLTNSNGTTTGSLRVDNVSDTGDDNFVIIHGSTIKGDIPTPAKVTIANRTTNTYAHRSYILAHGIDPYNPAAENALGKVYVFEGEDVSGATTVSSASSSEGAYGLLDFGIGSEIIGTVASWPIYDHVDSAGNGKTFAVVGRTLKNSNDGVYMYISPAIQTREADPVTVSKGSEITISPSSNFGLINFGVVTFPKISSEMPVAASTSTGTQYNLVLLYRDNTDEPGVAYGDWPLDFVCLLPTDGFRTIRVSSGSINGSGESVVLDEIEKICYETSSSSADPNPISKFSVTGKPIYLMPYTEQSLSLFTAASAAAGSAMNPAEYRHVMVEYRPRRLVI